jgi:hypothetical protein
MKHFIRPFLVSIAVLANVACSVEGDDDDAAGAGTGGSAGTSSTGGSGGSGVSGSSTSGTGGGGPACNSAIIANEVNNYHFQSTLTLPPILVKPEAELTIEWGGLTKDFMGHDLNPMTGIDTANVMLWKMGEAELQVKLNADQLTQREAEIPIKFNTMNTATTAMLFDFLTVADEPLEESQILPYLSVENYPPAENTYTAILAVGDLASGGDARMLQAFKLDPTSTNTVVTLTNTSTTLDYTADLHTLTPTQVPSGTNAISIDWTNMLTTSLGTEFLPAQITEARIARYDETPAELEANFLDLELDDEETYEAAVPMGTTITLDKFKSESGATFAGINGSGTWVLALICGSCRNPAPWYMTILKSCN